MITILTDEVLQANFYVQDIVDYVLAHDWQPKPHSNENIRVFVGPLDDEGNPIPLVLPADDSFTDKDLRLTEAVYLLAELEERSPTDIINAIITHTQEKQSSPQQVP